MTVSTSTAKAGPYAGAGSAGPFTIPFRFLDVSHLRVIKTSTAGLDSTLTITTDYSVAGVGLSSGSVTLTVPLAVGENLTVVRNVPLTQEADYVNNDAFPAESHETALDKLTMIAQQQSEQLGRALLLPTSASGISTTLPSPQSLKLLQWNESATALQNADASSLATLVAYGTAQADVFVGDGVTTEFTLSAVAAGTNNLDVSIGGVTQVPTTDYALTASQEVTFVSPPANGATVLIRYQQGLPEVGAPPTGAVAVADVAALRNQQKGLNKVVMTRHYSASKPAGGGGGVYICDIADTTTPNNDGTVIVGADGGRWRLQVHGALLPARQCGVSGDGSTLEGAKLLAADVMARAEKKGLFIEGTPLINDAQILLSNPTTWVFSGWHNNGTDNSGVIGSVIPASWLRLSAAQPTGQAAVAVTHPGIRFYGGGIGSMTQGLFPFDGIAIGANGFRWEGAPTIFNMGRDGFRIGTDLGQGNFNANSVHLDSPSSCWNGRHGFNISDDDGALDANTFCMVSPRAFNNTGHGFRFGNTYLGGTIYTPTVENNTIGFYFEPTAAQITIIGGNVEANTGPSPGGGPLQNWIFAGRSLYTNRVLGVATQTQALGITSLHTPDAMSKVALEGTLGRTAFTPTVYGATFAGVVDWHSRSASYTTTFGALHFWFAVRWITHSGTGQLYMDLPDLAGGIPLNVAFAGIPDFVPVTVICGTAATGGVTGAQQIVGLLNTTTLPARVQFYVQAVGVSSALAVPASGELYVSGSVPLSSYA